MTDEEAAQAKRSKRARILGNMIYPIMLAFPLTLVELGVYWGIPVFAIYVYVMYKTMSWLDDLFQKNK